MSFIDLFAGIGGIRIGFEAAGGQCEFSSEWDRFAQRTYLANFGETPDGDLRAIEPGSIPDHDVLTAGFPCQPFSIAGISKLTALGRRHGFENPEQGNLFFHVAAILDAKRPRAFLLENVKHLERHDSGRTFEVIRRTLEETLGYHLRYRVIDGARVVPQHRERIYIVGFRDAADAERFAFPELPETKTALRSVLDSSVDRKYTLTSKLWEYLQAYARKHRERGNGFGFGLPDLDGTARTLSARYHKDGSEILIKQEGTPPRRLTPRECARLMGFPESFRIDAVSDTQLYRQFGNSVVVPVVAEIARGMAAAMDFRVPRHGTLDEWHPNPQTRLKLSMTTGSALPAVAS